LEPKNFAEQLADCQNELQLIVDNTDEAFVLVNKDLVIIGFNKVMVERVKSWYGVEMENGMSMLDLTETGRREILQKAFSDALEGKDFEMEVLFLAPDGKNYFFINHFRPAFDKNNQVAGAIVISKDLTYKKRAQDALIKSEKKFRALIESSVDAITLISADGVIQDANAGLSNILGYSLEELIGTNRRSIIHPEDLSDAIGGISQMTSKPGSIENLEYRCKTKAGTYKWLHLTYHNLLHDEDIHGIVVVTRDITERKQAEEALKASEEKYRLLFYSNPIPMWIYDQETLKFLEVNKATVDHYGYSREEFRDMTLRDIRPVAEFDKLAHRLESIKNSSKFSFLQSIWSHKKKTGEIVFVEIKSHAIEYNSRSARLVLANDITERREAENKLFRERNLLRTLIDLLPDYIYVKDTECRHIINNEANVKLIGAKNEQETLGKTVIDYFGHGQADSFIEHDRNIIRTGKGIFNIEEIIKDDKGKIRSFLTTKVPLRDERSQVTGLVGISRDITEHKMLELALAEQKVNQQRSITEAAIQIQEKERTDLGRELHDNINQILTTTKLYIDMAINDEEIREQLLYKSYANISKAIEEIRSLSRSLVPPSLDDIGLATAITEMIAQVNETSKLKVTLTTSGMSKNTLSDPLKLMVYRIVQEQLNNIIKHAKAKKAAVKLSISKKILNIIVTDDGIGFDQKKKVRGIGLSNISSRAALHKGKVEIITAPEGGCTLKVFIPL
jgi:PAS domain S-box-containing protein